MINNSDLVVVDKDAKDGDVDNGLTEMKIKVDIPTV